MKKKFGIKDYWRMGKVRGIGFPVQYFLQNHFFDIWNKTDTHLRLEKIDYKLNPKNFEEGILYMSSLTNEVRKSLIFLKNILGNTFLDYQFLDLGCGKGKSVIIYIQLFQSEINYVPTGIEYYSPLVKVAKQNLKIKKMLKKGRIICDDARNFTKYLKSKKVIIYLYNPFGESILKDILKNLKVLNAFIIYYDPVHSKIIEENNFKCIFSKEGKYRNKCVNIYSNNQEFNRIELK